MATTAEDKKFHNKHNRNIATAEAQVNQAFGAMVQDVTALYRRFEFDLPEGGEFHFSEQDLLARKEADKTFRKMHKHILSTIQAGAQASDALSQSKEDKLLKRLDMAGQALRREETTARSLKEISDAVWKQCEQARAEMELALSVALKAGTDADQFSRDIRSYLNEPNKLFRRVRDEFGNLVLSKRAAAYHPGRGVYRSSYKNARRLAATEINMAYRKADNERWKRLDFVIGVHIEVSREHPTYDMCDELAGDYPKDFVFVGWHPHCRCIATPILQNIEDFKNGVSPDGDVFKVDSVPESFNKWVQGNKDRIANAEAGNATLPYFLRDNKAAMEKALKREAKPQQDTPATKKTPLEIAKEQEAKNYKLLSEFPNGGSVTKHALVNEEDSDYPKLLSVANHFAKEGKKVVLTPKVTRPKKFEYESIYGSLVGTPYEGKCPDLLIDGKWYEHEGFITKNAKRAFSNMVSHGIKQSSRIIIDKPDLSDSYMKRVIHQRLKDGHSIDEIWLREEDSISIFFPFKKSEER